MDFVIGAAGRSQDEETLTPQQIERLELFFAKYPHPSENQFHQLSGTLGLEVSQIKFWFLNKRTQTEAPIEIVADSVLEDNPENVHFGNPAIGEELKNITCPTYGGPTCSENEGEHILSKLELENAQLKQEQQRVYNLLSSYFGRQISEPESLVAALRSLLDLSPGSSLHEGIGSSGHDLNFVSCPAISDNNVLDQQPRKTTDMEKAIMVETATSAMEELVRILHDNEPYEVESTAHGRYVINPQNFEKIFHRANHLKGSSVHVEFSKDSRTVCMSGRQLVDMFLDSDKWVDLFPTIVTKAKTIQVIESGLSGNRSGALQLMYEQMHILSPLIPPREFIFLRKCQQIKSGVWGIVDVSFDLQKENASPPSFWKQPSGCIIEEMANGSSRVLWAEHVEVDGKTHTHPLYRDIVNTDLAYGAERWVVTLERMCERFSYSFGERAPIHEAWEAVGLPEGRRSIMKLGHRMVKTFCGSLNMSCELDSPQFYGVTNSGIWNSVHINTEPGQPVGVIVCAATSLWLPLPHDDVLDFFRDEKRRVQWDDLCYGNPMHVVSCITNGSDPRNRISIFWPFIESDYYNVPVFQETCVDTLGSLIVYAPIDVLSLTAATIGVDSSVIEILGSGFVISKDGGTELEPGASSSTNVGRSGGTLLTVAFQILVRCINDLQKPLNKKEVTLANALLSKTVENIKEALDCLED